MERMREGGFNIGGEQSGHIILHDYATTGDGLMSALQVLAVLVESGRADERSGPPVRQGAATAGERPLHLAASRCRTPGSRPPSPTPRPASMGVGRLLVRPSGTEKLIRVMAEGDDAALVKSVVADVVGGGEGGGLGRGLNDRSLQMRTSRSRSPSVVAT
jgi:phosphoglucosamine mutase